MWIQRDLEKVWLKEAALPVRIIRGVRQAGKTAFLEHHAAADHRTVLSMDDLGLRTLAQTDPGLLFEQYPPPVIIDEVQQAPALFSEIKRRVDAARSLRRRGRKIMPSGLFWLTGSNQILLQHASRESLAGRLSSYILHPLSVAELGAKALAPGLLGKLFLRGGWPELHIDSHLSASRYLNDYISTFIEKDIAQSAGIEKLNVFSRMLGLLAARTGTLFNASDLASACGVASPTIQDWVGVLERNWIVHALPGYSAHLTKRLIKTPRIYFMDVGLASRLQGWTDAEPLLKSPQVGLLFETLVLSEIIKTRDHAGKNWTVYYWRTKEGKEIDFLIFDERGTGIALEAKFSVHAIPGRVPVRSDFGSDAPPVDRFYFVVPGESGKNTVSSRKDVVLLARLRDHLLKQLA